MRFKWIALACLVTSASIGIGAGCGLDDSAITPLDSTGTDASFLDGGGGSDSSTDANADTGPTCEAKTCGDYPTDCHSALADGCGKTIDCSGACPSGQACVPDAGAGVDAGFFCNGPPVCRDAGAPGGNCDTLTNPGNGLTTNCGNCATAGDVCSANTCTCAGTVCGSLCCTSGSGGPNCNSTNNTCCTKTSTCPANNCSAAVSDNCGGTFNCRGNCGGSTVCDTGNNTCCTVTTTCGTSCNTTLTTNCGTSLPCGGCSNGETCNGSHVCTCTSGKTCGATCCPNSGDVCHPSTTCCTPASMASTCGGGCGNPVPNNCAQNVDCGACSDGSVCKAPGGCPCGSGGGQVTCNQNQTCHIAGASGNGSCSP